MRSLLNGKARHTRSASGGSITLTGSSTTPFLDDQTLAYNTFVFWVCENMTPSTQYQYVVFEPNGKATAQPAHNYNTGNNTATFTTDTTGRCASAGGGTVDPYYAQGYLGTPFTGTAPGTDAGYSGVWAIAVQNVGTGNYEAVAYTVIIVSQALQTYSDPGFTTASNDFAPGSTIYAQAAGLNPAHSYAFGFVNTSGNGVPCVSAVPPGSQNVNNNTCFKSPTTGVLASGGSVGASFVSPTTGGNSTGTYSLELYDATEASDSGGAGILVGTRQFSLNPSTVAWTLTPVDTAGTTGTNLNNTFATDGLLNVTPEQSVAGIEYSATGLGATRTYAITVSNSNGVIMQSTTTDTAANSEFGQPQFYTAPPTTVSSATGTITNVKVNFPINVANLTAFGGTQIPFANNVYTAQLYDTVAKTVVASKSFVILSYDGQFNWTTPAGTEVTANALNLPTNVTATVTNDAGTLFGKQNADGIVNITIERDSNAFVTLARQTGITTATDSNGQLWNINIVANNVVVTPNVGGQALAVGATIAIPFTVAVQSTGTNCKTAPCILETAITPQHGIDPSGVNATMTNTATNGLVVYQNGVVSATVTPSYAITVGAASNAADLPAPSPRYNQMMYDFGTNGAVTGYYPLTFTINNNGAPKGLYSIAFTMPALYSPNTASAAPCLFSMTTSAGNETANWELTVQTSAVTPTSTGACVTKTRTAVNGDPALPQNVFVLDVKAGQNVPINANTTATAVIYFPMFTSPFPFQDISATANAFDYSTKSGGVTAYTVGPVAAVTNAIAGATNIDSTEIGVYSLDTTSMSAAFNPSSIPTPSTISTVLKFFNTTTQVSPNPDYINRINLTVPTGAVPTSVTAVNPNQSGVTWSVNTVSAGVYRIELCTPGAAAVDDCTAANDLNGIPPGGELDITFNYTAGAPPTVGSYAVTWTVDGDNGGLISIPHGTSTFTVANTTAQTSFVYSGGWATPLTWPVYPATPGTPSIVPANSQPIIGSSADPVNGNQFVYSINNNGTNTITNVAITIPSSNLSGQLTDTQDWQLTPVAAPAINVYGAGTAGAKCSGSGIASFTQPVAGNPGTPGSIVLSGCNLAPGGTMYVGFTALEPYDINSQFLFSSTVSSTTPAVGPVTTIPSYTSSTTMRIISDVRLQINIPATGTGTTLFQSPYTTTGPSGDASAATVCVGCAYTNGATPLINLGSFNGTFTATDVLSASVYSNATTGWVLYVGLNPGNPGTSSGQVETYVSADSSSAASGGTYTKSFTIGAPLTLSATATGNPQSTGNNGTQISAFSGKLRRPPIDNIMSYVVTLNPLNVNNNTTTTMTLYYTVVPN